MRILLVDNRDSFTLNLEHLLASTIGVPETVSYDAFQPGRISCGAGRYGQPDLLVISPGPGHPSEYPKYRELFRSCPRLPVLGVCLGMQIINECLGGTTSRLQGCVHGRTDRFRLGERSVEVARYHSLFISSPGEGLDICASTEAGIPMILRHRELPLLGYQFHPESFLTRDGEEFIGYAIECLGLG